MAFRINSVPKKTKEAKRWLRRRSCYHELENSYYFKRAISANPRMHFTTCEREAMRIYEGSMLGDKSIRGSCSSFGPSLQDHKFEPVSSQASCTRYRNCSNFRASKHQWLAAISVYKWKGGMQEKFHFKVNSTFLNATFGAGLTFGMVPGLMAFTALMDGRDSKFPKKYQGVNLNVSRYLHSTTPSSKDSSSSSPTSSPTIASSHFLARS